MEIGDLVDDGFDNIGIIVETGWVFPEGSRKHRAYFVQFPDTTQNGWYTAYDLKKVFPPEEGRQL